jgi:hypothetical protein
MLGTRQEGAAWASPELADLYFCHHEHPENLALSSLPCTGFALGDCSRRTMLFRAGRSATGATEIG